MSREDRPRSKEQPGHEERFRALFDEHYRAVMRFVRTRGHSPTDAEDIVAATFEVVWKGMDRVPLGREALPWLLGIARNVSRNARRSARREAAFVDDVSALTLPWVELDVEQRATTAQVVSALGRLKQADRELILLVAWDELSPAEAGQVLGLRGVTARSRLHRARQRLTTLLAEADASAPPQTHDLPSSQVSSGEDGRAR